MPAVASRVLKKTAARSAVGFFGALLPYPYPYPYPYPPVPGRSEAVFRFYVGAASNLVMRVRL